MYTTYFLDSILKYPKYQGRTVKEVCHYNMSYLLWLMATHPQDFDLDEEVFRYMETLPYGKTATYEAKRDQAIKAYEEYQKFLDNQTAREEAIREHQAEMKMYDEWTSGAYE